MRPFKKRIRSLTPWKKTTRNRGRLTPCYPLFGDDPSVYRVIRSQRERVPSAEHRADLPDVAAQPAMRKIGIKTWMPEQRHRELWRGDRKRKTLHAGAQDSRMSFGNCGDQV